MKLNAKELRDLEETTVQDKLKHLKRRPIYFILENVYDTYNVGGLFRLADALCIEKMYLCGEMEIPPNHKIKKASIGTYKIVPWEYKPTAREAITELRNMKSIRQAQDKHLTRNTKNHVIASEDSHCLAPGVAKQSIENEIAASSSTPRNDNGGVTIYAVEQDKRSVDYRQVNYSTPMAFVLGNETYGVTPETLKLVDKIVEIPMWGINKSLNVIVSAAIVSYFAIGKA